MEQRKNPDRNILTRVQQGDLEAFEHLLSFFEQPIFNYCLRLVRNKEDAEDITQDSFVKVYTHRKLIDPEKNIKTWIFTIATNTAYDFIRRRKRHNEKSLDEGDETIDVLQAYYPQEGLVSDVEQALGRISGEYRKALLLFYQQGFEYKEIAEILSLPVNTVKTHISRGKEQLKQILEEYGEN